MTTDVDAVDDRGWSALMVAAAAGNADEVRALVARGANLELAEVEARTAIAFAARDGHLEVVRVLADAGADLGPGMAHAAEWAYRHSAATLEIVTLLLERGADVNARQVDSNDTALILAARGGWLELVELLLAHGADVHVNNIIDTTPLSAAARSGCVPVVKRLLAAGARLSGPERYGDSPLVEAIDAGHVEIVQMFVDRGALELRTRKPPLVKAAAKGNGAIVKVLLDRGADVNWADDSYDHDSALRVAAGAGHREVVELLIAHDARDTDDEHGAIRRAGGRGHLEVVEVLARAGLGDPRSCGLPAGVAYASDDPERLLRAIAIAPDLDAPDCYARPALHAAAERGHLGAVRVLLEHGADPNRVDKRGDRPHRLASDRGHTEVAALLEAHGARLELVELVDLAGTGAEAEVLALLARPLNVNVVRSDKRRALHEAAEHGRLAIVDALLARGAEIDAVDDEDWTALMEAADMGHLAIVERLLDRGAKPFLEDRQKFTAFALAVEAERADVVALLRARGADVNPAVALQQAIAAGDTATIERLAPLHGLTTPLPNYNEPLQFAAREGNAASIAALLALGVDVDRVASTHYTALYDAAERGHLAAVRALIAGGARPRANGTTQRAVCHGHAEIVAALLDAGFDPDEPVGESDSLVHNALYNGQRAIVRMLIDRGANLTGARGAQLLARAANSDEDAALVDELLAKGTPVEASSSSTIETIERWLAEGRTITLLDPQAALDKAAWAPNLAVVDLALAQGAKADVLTSGDAPLVAKCAGYGYWPVVVRLLAAGADPNARTYQSMPVAAARNGELAMLEKLAAAGAKLDGCIAMLLAAEQLPAKRAARDKVIALCLAHGDSLDAPGDGSDTRTPLVRAIADGDGKLARALVELGARIDAPDANGTTPLMTAAAEANLELVTWLVEQGANIHAADHRGVTAIHRAARVGAEAVVEALLARGAATAGCLSEAATSGKLSLVERFLVVCPLEERDVNGWTPVMNAAGSDNTELFEMLLARGADIAQCGIHAAWNGNREHLVIALDRGAAVDAQTKAGQTALMLGTGSPACIELLLKRGARVDLADEDGRTALMFAAMEGDDDVCRMLLAAGANRGLRTREGKSAADYVDHRLDELRELLEV